MKKINSKTKYDSVDSLFKDNRLGASIFQKNIDRLGISMEEALDRLKKDSTNMRSSTSSKKSKKSVKKFFSKLIKKK